MDPALFLYDLERKPTVLQALAERIATGDCDWPIAHQPPRVLLLGMGSSLYAAQVAALRLRCAGIVAVAESASAENIWPLDAGDVVVGISAGGTSAETNRLFASCVGAASIALTNVADSPITDAAQHTQLLYAEPELGGVACRSFTNTLVALLRLEEQLTGSDIALVDTVQRAAEATHELIDSRHRWIDAAIELINGPNGSWMVAPLERLASAQQSALMMRECPRRPAVGCETGDWSHVDVYLTRTLDYRAVVFPGSRWDTAAADWLTSRKASVLAVGGAFPGARHSVRFRHDTDPLVRLLVETTVAELVAAALWATAEPQEHS
jgi:glutamine---fructose-6-phosphate transaminase (isomerizing)